MNDNLRKFLDGNHCFSCGEPKTTGGTVCSRCASKLGGDKMTDDDKPKYTELQGVIFSDETEGAIAFSECDHPCRCEPLCAICGQRKHMAVHGPLFGHPPGSKPWGHKYRSEATEGIDQ